jgi:hypothetical protein
VGQRVQFVQKSDGAALDPTLELPQKALISIEMFAKVVIT